MKGKHPLFGGVVSVTVAALGGYYDERDVSIRDWIGLLCSVQLLAGNTKGAT